ncbi:MAG: HD domain-containing protein [Syntrophobacterales bacterium]|nr:MAG: HD domain-containing protein [Syntrophobacterales bacterium]
MPSGIDGIFLRVTMVDEEKEKVRFITPDWAKSPPPVMERGQLANQCILCLHGIMKAVRVHGADNVSLDQSISQCLHIINPFILSEGSIILEMAEEGFLLNNRKMRGKPKEHDVFKSFMKDLKERRIGKLEIHHPLDERELKELVFLLAALKKGNENNAQYLMKQLSARKIDSMRVGRLEIMEGALPQTAEKRGYARELYFAAIGIAQEIMEDVAEGRPLNIRKAKRLMQQMVAFLMEDEFMLLGLAVIKDYGQYLYNHSVNVAVYSISLGRQLELPKKNLVQLGIAGLFHDIGKIKIPQSILDKSGQLTAEELRIIQKHPIYGVETIAQSNGWNETTARMMETAFEHHIKEDWTGYPKSAAKRELTLFGKIIAIADFYDNIIRSPSHQLFPVFSDRATGLLLERGGRDFDPTLAKLFVNMIGFYPIGTLVILENGEMGIVVAPNKDMKLTDRPKVLRFHFQDGAYKGRGVLDLAEKEDEKGKYRNTIAKPLDPNEYQLNVAELFFYG